MQLNAARIRPGIHEQAAGERRTIRSRSSAVPESRKKLPDFRSDKKLTFSSGVSNPEGADCSFFRKLLEHNSLPRRLVQHDGCSDSGIERFNQAAGRNRDHAIGRMFHFRRQSRSLVAHKNRRRLAKISLGRDSARCARSPGRLRTRRVDFQARDPQLGEQDGDSHPAQDRQT